jgi:hypothetical protein
MYRAAPATSFSSEDCISDWAQTLDRIIAETEAAEFDLATKGDIGCRQKSGSYYTPHDVADHFWLQFFRFHNVKGADGFRALIARTHFVEPSAGSGIFVFTLLRQALRFGLHPRELATLRFSVIDINFTALQFVGVKLGEAETSLGVNLTNVGLTQRDFLDWAASTKFENVIFVGNPPFVSNARGSRWRNLYADFLESMLDYPARSKSLSLILPVSICFSRDYADLRQIIRASGMGVCAASYDNIPDSLFKSGKPESKNTNRANSQRCTILHIGGPNPDARDSAPLLRWAARQRDEILGGIPDYQSFATYRFDNQIPRPSNNWILKYLAENASARSTRTLMSRQGRSDFSLGTVARNFIGVRETTVRDATSVPIKAASELERFVLLQIFGSQIFYEFWRTLGDGFHVTNDLIERFPVSPALYESCVRNLARAQREWGSRAMVLKEKLNCGRVTRTYDFSKRFDYLSF